jgi:ADP-heptose:LPS heptosyltransferase
MNHQLQSQSQPLLWQQIAPDVKRIGLFFSSNKLGDAITTLPVIEKIKECFPEAELYLIGSTIATEVYSSHPYINKHIVCSSNQSIIETFKIIDILRNKKFDLIIDLYRSKISELICFFSNANIRIGFKKTKPDLVNKIAYTHRVNKIVVHDLYKDLRQILHGLEIDTSTMKNNPSFPFQSIVKHQVLKNLNLINTNYWTLNLGAAVEQKIYPIKHFSTIASYLISKNQKVAIIYNPDAPCLQEQFKTYHQNQLNKNLLDIIYLPKLTLQTLAELIKTSKGVITSDTGILHLGCAVKTQTIGCFVGIRQTVVIDGNHFHPIIEKNLQNPSPAKVIGKIDLIMKNQKI